MLAIWHKKHRFFRYKSVKNNEILKDNTLFQKNIIYYAQKYNDII